MLRVGVMIVNFSPGAPTIASVFIATPGLRDPCDYADHVILREAHAQEEDEGFPAARLPSVTPMVSSPSGPASARRAARGNTCSAGSSALQVTVYSLNGGQCPTWNSWKLNWCPRYISAFKKWPEALKHFPWVCCCRHPLGLSAAESGGSLLRSITCSLLVRKN